MVNEKDCTYIRYESGGAECLKNEHFIKSQLLIMTSFKQKTQKYYEAVGVFSEETLPPPCSLFILLYFSQKKMFSTIDTCHISILKIM